MRGRWQLDLQSTLACDRFIRPSDFEFMSEMALKNETVISPSDGQRIVVLGGRSCFANLNLPDDGSASDTAWRSSPSFIWRAALRAACEQWGEARIPVDIDSANQNASARTGARSIQDIHSSRVARQRKTYDRCLR